MSDHERTAAIMVPSRLAEMAPAKKSSTWFDQPAQQVGEVQIDHLTTTLQALQTNPPSETVAPMCAALQTLLRSHGNLNFETLQTRGWWARATGKARSAGAEFSDQVADVVVALERADEQAAQFQADHTARAATDERLAVEMELDLRALDDLVDKGAKWLQDMQAQLKQRHAAAQDEAQRQGVRRDAARCEALVARLKALRGLGAATRKVLTPLREAQALRLAQVQALTRDLPAANRAWRARLVSLAAAVEDGADGPELSLEGPREVHAQLGTQVTRLDGGMAQLQTVESQWEAALGGMADSLAALRATGAGAA